MTDSSDLKFGTAPTLPAPHKRIRIKVQRQGHGDSVHYGDVFMVGGQTSGGLIEVVCHGEIVARFPPTGCLVITIEGD